MKKTVKQVVGIDVAQNELVTALGCMYDDWTPQIQSFKSFSNNRNGFEKLIAWMGKLTDPLINTRFVMEATGVYHESLAYFLEAMGFEVSIVLPNKISNYFKTLKVKTITDKTASEAIALFGLERKLDIWQRPNESYKRLRQLTRERDQIIEERTLSKNQLHAEESEAEPNKNSVVRVKKRIAFLDKQIKEIIAEIDGLAAGNQEVKDAVKLISSIPGIGTLTAVTILAETNGFDLIRNRKQLASYAGLDVVEKQSGTSVKGKSRISKKGNKHLRKAMHMPALTSVRHDERFKGIYARLIARHGVKMKALVPIQRKLLELAYMVYKTKKSYEKDYLEKQANNQVTAI